MDAGLSQGVNSGLGDTIGLFIRRVQAWATDLLLIWQHLRGTQEGGKRGSGGWRDGAEEVERGKVSLRRREMDKGGCRWMGVLIREIYNNTGQWFREMP